MATLYSAVSQGKRARFAVMGRKVYMTDGWRPMQVWNGLAATSSDAGITGPSQAVGAWAPTPSTASGSCTAGTHKFRYRYLNSLTGYVSEPSNEVAIVVAAGAEQLTFAIDTSGSGNIIRSSDGKVDRIVVEMTLAGGQTFYKASEGLQSASTIVVSISDRTLANQTLRWPGRTSAEFGMHLVPPIASHVIAYRGRLFAFGQVVHELGTVALTNGSNGVTGTGTDWTDAVASPVTSSFRNRTPRFFQRAGDATAYQIAEVTLSTALTLDRNYAGTTGSGLAYKIFTRDNDVYYSLPSFPESFPALNTFPGPEGGRLRAMIGHQQMLVMFTLSTMERITYTSDPGADGRKLNASTERGAVCQEVVLNVEETLYALDRRGFHSYDGGFPKPISRGIESYVARINFAQEAKFHGCFYPKLRAIRWWVAIDSDTEPKTYFQFDVDRQVWSVGHREVAVTGSALVPTASGVAVLAVDENGNTWFDDEGTTDGADALSDAQVRAAVGATTTVIPLRETLPASPALVGVPVWFEELDEARRITAHTTSQITVNSAFTRAPVFDEKLHLGRIKAKLRTKAFRSRAEGKHSARYVYVHYVPLTESRKGRLRIYRNQSTSPVSDYELGPNVSLRGVTAPSTGGSDWILDFGPLTPSTNGEPGGEGMLRIPAGLGSAQTTEVELELTDADVPVRILGITIDGVDLEPVT